MEFVTSANYTLLNPSLTRPAKISRIWAVVLPCLIYNRLGLAKIKLQIFGLVVTGLKRQVVKDSQS